MQYTCTGYCESWILSLPSLYYELLKEDKITSLNTMYCGVYPEQDWMYYLCTDFAYTFSKWHYIIVYKSKGQKDRINTFQSALKSVLCNLY